MVLITTILLSSTAFSQLAIGLEETSNSSISLEFGNENRGIILPWVTSENDVVNAPNGTFIFDSSDNKVKVKYATGWEDLSIDETGTTINPITDVNGLQIQNALTEQSNAKVSIGEDSDVEGILVLENTNQAMVLPKVASPHLNILNPTPGLIVFDTASGQLAVFNGSVWTFWKP